MTTVYLKITPLKGKSKTPRIEQREAWDVDRFLSSITKQYAEDKTSPARVEEGTREEYLEQIKRD